MSTEPTQHPHTPPGLGCPAGITAHGMVVDAPLLPSGPWGCPGCAPATPHFGNPQLSSPFLCALFFVLLKFSPSCWWSPPPAQPQRGGGGCFGVIRNPDCVSKLDCGSPPQAPRCVDSPHPGRDADRLPSPSSTPTPQERAEAKPSPGDSLHSNTPLPGTELWTLRGGGSQADCKWWGGGGEGVPRQEKRKHCISSSILPRRKKLSKPRPQYLNGQHKEPGLS